MVICSTCKTEKKKSKVFSVPINSMTLEVHYDHTFWDEDDNFHNHNHSTNTYGCSNKHEFTIKEHCAFGDCCD